MKRVLQGPVLLSSLYIIEAIVFLVSLINPAVGAVANPGMEIKVCFYTDSSPSLYKKVTQSQMPV